MKRSVPESKVIKMTQARTLVWNPKLFASFFLNFINKCTFQAERQLIFDALRNFLHVI